MKIFFVWHSLVEPQYRKYPAALADLGHQVRAVCPAQWTECGQEQSVNAALKQGAFELYPLKAVFKDHIRSFFFLNHARLKRLIHEFQPDIVHVFEDPYALVTGQVSLACRGLRVRPKFVIQTFENILARQPMPFRWVERSNLRAADCLITVPLEGEVVWRSKGYTGHVSHLAIGLDETLYAGMHEKTDASCIDVCYIGRIVPEKNVGALLRAFLKASDGRRDVRLTIVGSGPLRAIFKKAFPDDRIRFVDPVKNSAVPGLLSAMDILVLPSLTTPVWKEQFGRVLTEAMASGVAVIGSSSGEIPQVIGDAGIIVPENDEESLRRALNDLFASTAKRESLKRAGYERVLRKFTWPVVVRDLQECYGKITA